MTFQRLLLKLYGRGLLPARYHAHLKNRVWTIEAGEARGLRFSFVQNLDYLLGSSELPMQTCIASNLDAGGVFYDVGANVGFFSLLATTRIGPRGLVYAFEPLAENAAAIRRNMQLNALTNVSVFEVAVDARAGTGELLVSEWDGGSSLSTTGAMPANTRQRRNVPVISLDEFVVAKGLEPPTLVKIDVEGAESGVLQGMTRIVQTHKPALVYEVDDGDRASFERRWKALDEFVSGLGYRVTHLEESYPDMNWHVGHSLARPVATS